MTYEELKEQIINSNQENWLYDESKRIFTCKNNLNINIKREYPDASDFAEDWANKFVKPPSRMQYEIYYGASFVESLYFVALDEHRAEVPLPTPPPELKINNYQYAVARIGDRRNSLDDYMNRAGITLEE